MTDLTMPDYRRAGRLLGLVGPKRSGKDTVAATLVDECGWRRVAFADHLRWVAGQANPTLVHVDEPRQFPAPLSYLLAVNGGWEALKDTIWDAPARAFLQRLGVAMRAVDPGVWVRAAMLDVDAWRADGTDVVVTDVRFQNEADAIIAAGGRLVRVHRDTLAATDRHVSETEQASIRCHRVIRNGGTLADLADAARQLDTVSLTAT